MYQRILVPVDGSPVSNRGLAEAIALARLTAGRLRLIHVVDGLSLAMGDIAFTSETGEILPLLRAGGEKILAAAQRQFEGTGVPFETVLRDTLAGRVCDLVVEEATDWSADLIAIGTHGRRGVGRMLLGSDAEQILRLAPVPVLLVRAQ
jgi:nucleotide-binding universal stress UspA family protein